MNKLVIWERLEAVSATIFRYRHINRIQTFLHRNNQEEAVAFQMSLVMPIRRPVTMFWSMAPVQ